MSQKLKFTAIAFGLSIGLAGSANAAWQPAKPIEFIATAGPGGGTVNCQFGAFGWEQFYLVPVT